MNPTDSAFQYLRKGLKAGYDFGTAAVPRRLT
jgi:hypothetical protein